MKKSLLSASFYSVTVLTLFLFSTITLPAQYGNVSTIAGDGTQGFSGDGGPATAAVTNFPSGIAIDNVGNIYFSEITNSVVRKIATDGTISTVAGMVGDFGFSGDGGQATSAELDSAQDMAIDDNGNIYISDWLNNKIRKVDATTGVITTIAGTGSSGFSGDGAAATAARLKSPSGITLDAAGNIYFSDRGNDRIRKIAPDGIITTIAGKGGFNAFSGDGGQAIDAEFNDPNGLTIDNTGNLYVMDRDNHRIRKITTDGIVNTIVGTGDTGFSGGGFNGDNQLGTATELDKPTDVVIDASGNVIFNDNNNHRVRKLESTGTLSIANFSKIGAIYTQIQQL